jgi:hypothetical protein
MAAFLLAVNDEMSAAACRPKDVVRALIQNYAARLSKAAIEDACRRALSFSPASLPDPKGSAKILDLVVHHAWGVPVSA